MHYNKYQNLFCVRSISKPFWGEFIEVIVTILLYSQDQIATYYAIKKTSSSANDNVTVANNLFLEKGKMYEVTSPQKCDDNFEGKFNQDYTGDDTAGNTGSSGDNPNCN